MRKGYVFCFAFLVVAATMTAVQLSVLHEPAAYMLLSMATATAASLVVCLPNEPALVHALAISGITFYHYRFNVLHDTSWQARLAEQVDLPEEELEDEYWQVLRGKDGEIVIRITNQHVETLRFIQFLFICLILGSEGLIVMFASPPPRSNTEKDDDSLVEDGNPASPATATADAVVRDASFQTYYSITSNIILIAFAFSPSQGNGLYRYVRMIHVYNEKDNEFAKLMSDNLELNFIEWIMWSALLILSWTWYARSEYARLARLKHIQFVDPVCKCITLLYMPVWWIVVLIVFNHVIGLLHKRRIN